MAYYNGSEWKSSFSTIESRYNKKSQKSTSSERFTYESQNYTNWVRDAAYEATLVIKGNFDIDIAHYIEMDVRLKDGSQHYTSGTYQVMSKIDQIEGDFTTTLKMFKLNGSTDSTSMKFHSSGGGSLSYSGSYGGYTGYGVAPDGEILPGDGTGKSLVSLADKYCSSYPYVWGGDDPSEGGFDCSGMISYASKLTGRDYGRCTSVTWRRKGVHVDKANVQLGDVLCYPGHVALYVDDNTVFEAGGRAKGIGYHSRNVFYNLLDIRRIV